MSKQPSPTNKDKSRDDWLSQARTLSEALPYMRRHSGETLVIKYGGHAMGDNDLSSLFARDIVLLRQIGANPVVVHGGGPQIGKMLDRLKVKSEFVEGLRVTDDESIEIVEMVLSGSINKQIVSTLNAAGGFAVGLSGKDGNLIICEKLQRTERELDSNINRILDLGLVGEPKTINTHVLDNFERSDITPVIAPIGIGTKGETLNVNADTAAGAIASALNARRLLMLTDVAGVLDSDGDLIPHLSVSEAKKLLKRGTIHGGMIPKVKTCLKAIESGVKGAVIIDGRVPHALLLELFTEHGAGTLIEAD
jgi:acetylglutamate kinase